MIFVHNTWHLHPKSHTTIEPWSSYFTEANISIMPQKEEDDPALFLWCMSNNFTSDDELSKNLYNEAKNNTLVVLAALAGRL